MGSEAFLTVDHLRIGFPGRNGAMNVVVDGVSLKVAEGERVGLVGSSGSGKSLTALACLGLVPEPGRLLDGTVTVAGKEIFELPPSAATRLRGAGVGIVFQEAAGSFNPVYTVGFQIAETVRIHRRSGRREARRTSLRLLEETAVTEPRRIAASYPHQLSGGETQRAMLAMALAGNPTILIADEPTSALDVVTQAQILELLRTVTTDRGLGLLLISHDLEVVSGVVDRVHVMYAGRVIEEGGVEVVFDRPQHPYTRLMLAASGRGRSDGDYEASADPIDTLHPAMSACRCTSWCTYAVASCTEVEPPLKAVADDHKVRCPVVVAES